MDQFKDFKKIDNIKFDIVKLREALKNVLSRKKYDDAIKYFSAAISSLKEIDNHIDSIIKNLTSLNITHNQNLLDQTINTTHQFEKNKKKFIVLGTGGSSLGSKTLINIIDVYKYKKIYFHDNIDPIYFKNSLQGLDLIEVGFIIISKSGTTAETLSQFACLIELFIQINKIKEFYQNCLIITENNSNHLRKISNH